MSSPSSITNWIRQLQAGNHEGAQQLWESYFRRLVALARSKLQGTQRRAADEEDVALSAFDSFCRGAEQGRFPQLNDRHDLWPLLVIITVRKAGELRAHEGRQKRGGGKLLDLQALPQSEGTSGAADPLETLVSPEPTPELAVQVAEEYQRLLDQLDNDGLRRVAQWKIEGYTTDEIAAQLGCVPRTVERKLHVIRTLWSKELPP